MEPVLDLARRGRGIAYLPHFAVQNCMGSGELVGLLDGVHEKTGSLYLLWPSSRYPLSKVRVFVDFIATRLVREFQGLSRP